jgi:OmpA family/K319L-like, PKD domain
MFMRKLFAALGAIGIFSTCLFAQGMTSSQTKDQWEEINFEFNSSILSDGYPSLLRLAEILGQHRDYHVKLTGHTDSVGSERYNERLAERRAVTVRDFLVKYGAAESQFTIESEGKQAPEVSNGTKEGRFMNRRVTMVVTDGQGKVIAAGGAAEVMPTLADLLKKQEECCSEILKRLDKLDDILAALRDLKGENDRLKGQVAELQNAQKALEDKVNGMPKPVTAEQTAEIAKKQGEETLHEAQRRNKKFSVLGLNVGPTVGNRPSGDVTFSGSARFFSPFGGDGTHAVQAQGEYMYYPGRQEGQFDIGLVNRWNHLQAGLFSSFKYIRFREYENGGSMAQGAFLLDYVFNRGRIGFYGTEGFKNTGSLLNTTLGPSSYLETYARPMNQVGGTAQIGVWGDAWIQGNLGYIHSHIPGNQSRPGGEVKLVQPISRNLAFTVDAGLNPTLVTTQNNGQITFGLEFGNFLRPKDYMTFTHPVPMDVPRIRYEFLTRQVGHSAPVADAGPNQVVPPGTVTLNGSGSYSPDHEPLNFSWTQTAGPMVALTGANTATATFTGAAGNQYSFRLTVTGAISGLISTANTSVFVRQPLRVVEFSATPNQITAGQQSILRWNVPGAQSVSISPGVGKVNPAGSATVMPLMTTTYTLTATGAAGETVTATATVSVGASMPSIVRFEATPTNITQGESSTLSWATTGAASVSISGVGSNLAPNGSTVVSPSQTTTYTLTATGADMKSTVTATVVVTVGGGSVPRVISFGASPMNISPGGTSQLCWNVENATSVSISPAIGTVDAVACATVSPAQTTTYVLTATNAVGPIQASVTVTVGGVQILSFSADPAFSPVSGSPVVLSWTTQNATSVVITGTGAPSGTLPNNGSATVYPTTNTDYTLTAYGPGGPVSVVLHVFVR